MLSLLLTLLVPVIGRHIRFISPWGAFVVLAVVVLVLATQLIDAEANVRPMDMFLYILVAVLVLALFAVVAGQGNLTLFQKVLS